LQMCCAQGPTANERIVGRLLHAIVGLTPCQKGTREGFQNDIADSLLVKSIGENPLPAAVALVAVIRRRN
jgi:hypothetical protein